MTCAVLLAGALLVICPISKPKPHTHHTAKPVSAKEFRDRWLQIHFRERAL